MVCLRIINISGCAPARHRSPTACVYVTVDRTCVLRWQECISRMVPRATSFGNCHRAGGCRGQRRAHLDAAPQEASCLCPGVRGQHFSWGLYGFNCSQRLAGIVRRGRSGPPWRASCMALALTSCAASVQSYLRHARAEIVTLDAPLTPATSFLLKAAALVQRRLLYCSLGILSSQVMPTQGQMTAEASGANSNVSARGVLSSHGCWRSQ